MMEAEGEFALEALRFSVQLAQRDFQAELLRRDRPHGGAALGWLDIIREHLDRAISRSLLNSSTRSVTGRNRSGASGGRSASRPRCCCEIWKRRSRRLAASNGVRGTAVTCRSM